ncbi:MAG TPA: acetyl-CoA carboxylase biotin carboxyl carrier protein [Acidobacteriota bacterium]|nr:acetyl-CoA carboxylase biotin carboxyl carrier protein [Acidobacteriota bacterium]
MNIEKIRRLIELVEESDVDSLEIHPFLRTAIKITKSRQGNHNGSLRGAQAQLPEIPPSAPVSTPAATSAPVAESPPAAAPSNLIEITAPMVGTLYRAPAPDAPPFVEVGQTIKPGDVLCIIEAMKLMNEIEAEHKGRIVEIRVENAHPVEFGQVLFTLDPTGT